MVQLSLSLILAAGPQVRASWTQKCTALGVPLTSDFPRPSFTRFDRVTLFELASLVKVVLLLVFLTEKTVAEILTMGGRIAFFEHYEVV